MALIVGRWLYAAYQWLEPPGAPWWRIYAMVLAPELLALAVLYGLDLAHVWSAWIR